MGDGTEREAIDALLWTMVRAMDLRCMVIFEEGRPYMARFYLHREEGRGDRPALLLHHFFASDARDSLHNHPWDLSYSLILTGGYEEEFFVTGARGLPGRDGRPALERRRVPPGTLHEVRQDTFHRVELLGKGCWTLFVAGRRTDSWSYWHRADGRFEDWRIRNERVKGGKSVERMSARDPRLEAYREEAAKAWSG